MLYCDFRSEQKAAVQINVEDRELIDWFAAINSHMTTDLCLLCRIIWGYWDYKDDEYTRYVQETSAYLEKLTPENRTEKILSDEEFSNVCAEDNETWVDPTRLQQVAEDLVRVFHEMKPSDKWWYHEDITPRHFHALAKTLAVAVEKGYTKVRLNCE